MRGCYCLLDRMGADLSAEGCRYICEFMFVNVNVNVNGPVM